MNANDTNQKGQNMDEETIEYNKGQTVMLKRKRLTDGSYVYAVSAKDRDDNWATYECVAYGEAICMMAAFDTYTMA